MSELEEKLVKALANVMLGFDEMHRVLEEECGELFEGDPRAAMEMNGILRTHARAVLCTMMDREDFLPKEVARVIHILAAGLEEVDSEVFEGEVSPKGEGSPMFPGPGW